MKTIKLRESDSAEIVKFHDFFNRGKINKRIKRTTIKYHKGQEPSNWFYQLGFSI